MAAQSFPYNLCTVLTDDYGFVPDASTRRSQFDSGAVAVKKFQSSPLWIRTMDIAIKQSNFENFRSWLEENGYNWFNYRDIHDQVEREVRLRDDPDYNYNGKETYQGERYWSLSLTLEGYL